MKLAKRAASLDLFKGLKVEERCLLEDTLGLLSAGVTTSASCFPFRCLCLCSRPGWGVSWLGWWPSVWRHGVARGGRPCSMQWLVCPVALWRTLTGKPRWVSALHRHTGYLRERELCLLRLLVYPVPLPPLPPSPPPPPPPPPSLCAQVALASDHVGSVQEQFVVLQLTVMEGGGVRKHHQVELNRAELDTLLTSLEGCSKVGGGGAGTGHTECSSAHSLYVSRCPPPMQVVNQLRTQ